MTSTLLAWLVLASASQAAPPGSCFATSTIDPLAPPAPTETTRAWWCGTVRLGVADSTVRTSQQLSVALKAHHNRFGAAVDGPLVVRTEADVRLAGELRILHLAGVERPDGTFLPRMLTVAHWSGQTARIASCKGRLPEAELRAACLPYLDTLLSKGKVAGTDLPASGVAEVQGRLLLAPSGCTTRVDEDRVTLSCDDRMPAMLTWVPTAAVGDVDAADALLAATLDAVEEARGLQAWHEASLTCLVEGRRGRCLKAGLPVDSDGAPRSSWFGQADIGTSGISVMCSYTGEVDALPPACAEALAPWQP